MNGEINPQLEAIHNTEPIEGLCKLCTHAIGRIYEDPGENWFTFPRYGHPLSAYLEQPDIEVIQKLAALGCRLCSFVWILFKDSVRSYYGPPPKDLGMDFDSYVGWVAHDVPRLEMGLSTKPNLDPAVYTLEYNFRSADAARAFEEVHPSIAETIYVSENPRDVGLFCLQVGLVRLDSLSPGIFPISSQQPLCESTSLVPSWNQCISWLDQCISHHDSCNEPNSHECSLPTRLIDVGDDLKPPHICTSDEVRPNSKYATLSHCWGDQKKVTLNKETLGPFRKRIPPEALSKTFNEAIEIVRRLSKSYGVQYLWIDSLCILQDNLEDWRQVASTMADIYGNGWCNIAATKAPDGREGLFSTRDPSSTQPLIVTAPDQKKYVCVNADRWTDSIDDAPLNQRAWVIQERLLSRRILHFAEKEIFFECQNGRASETFFRGEPIANDFTTDGVKDALLAPLGFDQAELLPWDEVWTTIVETVSGGNLSFLGDKLIAFAGVAKRFQQIYDPGEYLAGLWGKELERQLVWKTQYGTHDLHDVQAKRSDIRRAPSWSWTALEADIDGSWAPSDGDFLITIIDASVESVNGDQFSEVEDWVLRIQCRLISGTYDANASRGNEILLDLSGTKSPTRLFFYPDVRIEMELGQEVKDMFCVPVFCVQEDDECIQGLVLESTGLAKGQYRRIGTFEDLIEEEIMVLRNGLSEKLGDCESSQGNGLCTISIV